MLVADLIKLIRGVSDEALASAIGQALAAANVELTLQVVQIEHSGIPEDPFVCWTEETAYKVVSLALATLGMARLSGESYRDHWEAYFDAVSIISYGDTGKLDPCAGAKVERLQASGLDVSKTCIRWWVITPAVESIDNGTATANHGEINPTKPPQ